MPITVDPERPTELVTDLGVTEDSTRFLDAWIMLFRGGGAFFARVFYRQAQPARRCR
ncbi:hypothetical protein OHA21_01445 [Actinoplanes sp. NBC_00393]|uniref:hypothetical protein n=1 Tax=Actinoplanes sp. NBC_00393 TaxID=2975953 RepID=UPI002E1FB048